jgi:hypothetical protein
LAIAASSELESADLFAGNSLWANCDRAMATFIATIIATTKYCPNHAFAISTRADCSIGNSGIKREDLGNSYYCYGNRFVDLSQGFT